MRNMKFLAGFLVLGLALTADAQERAPVEFLVAPGQGSAVPFKQAVAWANGGVVDVAQPNPTTLIVTMSGITATNADLVRTSVANYRFQLTQGFTVAFNSPRVKSATLTLEGRVIGLLRTDHEAYTHAHGPRHCPTAETEPACAAVTGPGGNLLTLTLPSRSASGCEDLSVYDHAGPFTAAVTPGDYVLQETWGFGTIHPAFCCHGASAEFAPRPSPSALPAGHWFEHFQPFNGEASKDFGYQVLLKIVPEYKAVPKPGAEEGGAEPVPAPKSSKEESPPEKKPSTKEKP